MGFEWLNPFGEGSSLAQLYEGMAQMGTNIAKGGEYAWKGLTGEYARQAAEEQKKSAALQARMGEIQARKAKIAQQREARIRQAQIIASGAATVGEGTSGTAGAIGSIQSQLAQNISGINVQQDIAGQISAINQNLADIQSKSAQGEAAIKLASIAAAPWGGAVGLATTIFGGNTYKGAGQATPFSPEYDYKITSGSDYRSHFGSPYFRHLGK